MKNRERLSMYVDITKKTIVLCWLSLIAFWCLKLFGGNFFKIIVNNDNFIEFSDLVQNTWLKYLVSFFTITISNYFIICAVCQKFVFKGKAQLIVFAAIISMWAVSNFVPIEILYIPYYYGYIVIFAFGLYFNKGINKLAGILAVLFEFVFTSVSMIIRNIPLHIMDNYLIVSILMIDVYIMIGLYYLYSNLIRLERGNDMILLGHGWLSKETAQVQGYNSWKRFCHNVGYAFSFKWAKKK